MTLLGFDFGTRRIGVAVGNRISGTAQPLVTLESRDGGPDWAAIAELIATWSPQALVVGLPLTLDGEEQEVSRLARRFANRLHGRFGLPVELADERLSSREVERRFPEQIRKDRSATDRLAACEILQSWLEMNRE